MIKESRAKTMAGTMTRVAICGGSGYTGSELLRLLAEHPGVTVTAATSEKSAGKAVTGLFPHLYSCKELIFSPLDKEALLERADLFFMALPHSASQEAVHYFHSKGKKVIDLSADFRLRNPEVYEEWYGVEHGYPDTLKQAVYGLPELYRKEIAGTSLVASPGCYPTSAILALYPAITQGIVEPGFLVVDSKSGTSGAGRKGEVGLSFSEVFGGFRAYGVASHRHTPEIEQELSRLAGEEVAVNFTPHLLPVARGILSTVYAPLAREIDLAEAHRIYRDVYAGEPFVKILDAGSYPDIKRVCATNNCEIGLAINAKSQALIIVSVIDNLIKGASGQAIQSMNIMLGLEETTALTTMSVYP